MTLRRALWAIAVILAAALCAEPVAASTEARSSRTVVLAYLPSGGSSSAGSRAASADDAFEAQLVRIPALSLAVLSATQGAYSQSQMLLDLSQGARLSSSAYSGRPPPLLLASTPRAGGAVVASWSRALRRAAAAPQTLVPGLLASSIPGGGGYAGIAGQSTQDAAAAADRGGRVAAFSLGSPATLVRRVAALEAAHRLVTTDLPAGTAGRAILRALIERRRAGEMLIVVQRPLDRTGHELLWVGVAGLPGGGGQRLSSDTTSQGGLVATIDLAPTILDHLGIRLPGAMRGTRMRNSGALDGDYLRGLMARLRVVYQRRVRTLGWLVLGWALAVVLLAPIRRAALRIGALAMLWLPVAALIPAAIEPTAASEIVLLAGAALALAALTDRLLPWPRGPLLPAVAAVIAITVDALAGTQLLMRSLLGPVPVLGVRFHGIGNELKSGLAVLVFAGAAASLTRTSRRRRAVVVMAASGGILAVVEGSARLGAGVGGAILVAAGAAAATVTLLPGRLTRRRGLLALATPAVALLLLAALDLLTAHGTGHFTGSVLHARSPGDLRDIVVRRYGAAFAELMHGAMPIATAAAIAAAAAAIRWRERIYSELPCRAWSAALVGGLTAGVVGALSEDSGPLLLVVAVFTLGCLTAYINARPQRSDRGAHTAGSSTAVGHGAHVSRWRSRMAALGIARRESGL